MSIVMRGRVRAGRLMIDEPIDLPEDAEVDVAIFFDDGQDSFDSEERAQIDAAIAEGKAAMARGDVFPIEQVLAEL
jgi:hypothetical protein